jgi:hypothetical protein
MSGGQPMIAVDSGNSLHIIYPNNSNDVIYTTNRSGGWNTYNIEEGVPAGIAIDNSDKVHIIYWVYDSSSGRSTLKYATNK